MVERPNFSFRLFFTLIGSLYQLILLFIITRFSIFFLLYLYNDKSKLRLNFVLYFLPIVLVSLKLQKWLEVQLKPLLSLSSLTQNKLSSRSSAVATFALTDTGRVAISVKTFTLPNNHTNVGKLVEIKFV